MTVDARLAGITIQMMNLLSQFLHLLPPFYSFYCVFLTYMAFPNELSISLVVFSFPVFYSILQYFFRTGRLKIISSIYY